MTIAHYYDVITEQIDFELRITANGTALTIPGVGGNVTTYNVGGAFSASAASTLVLSTHVYTQPATNAAIHTTYEAHAMGQIDPIPRLTGSVTVNIFQTPNDLYRFWSTLWMADGFYSEIGIFCDVGVNSGDLSFVTVRPRQVQSYRSVAARVWQAHDADGSISAGPFDVDGNDYTVVGELLPARPRSDIPNGTYWYGNNRVTPVP